jgi:hypothetical protein
VAPIIQTGLFALGWCGSGNRYDDVTESEPMMFVTVLLPYSIFRFVCISRFVIFLIGLQIVLWIPNQLSPWHLPFPPAPQMDRCSSLPCRFCLCASAGKRPSNSVCKFLQDRVLPARRTRFLSKCNTSKRPSKSTTLLLPNLIIVLIIGPWIGPALAPFFPFFPLPFTFRCLKPITVTQATAWR